MTPWVRRLIFANAAMLLVVQAFPLLGFLLSLTPAFVLRMPWTPVTYMFLHADLFHLLFNMLALYFFGPRLEERLGSGRFLALYLVSGLVAALLSILFAFNARVVGASGAVFGVLLGSARYWPRDRIFIWGILPVEARFLVGALAALSLWAGFTGSGSGVAHFAHLGGFLGGFLFLKFLESRSAAARFRARAQPAARPSLAGLDLARWARIDRSQLHPLNREEVDRLLAKARDGGASSLTPDERAFLDRFSAP
jgi:membrane associated rhomboid family serine protease